MSVAIQYRHVTILIQILVCHVGVSPVTCGQGVKVRGSVRVGLDPPLFSAIPTHARHRTHAIDSYNYYVTIQDSHSTGLTLPLLPRRSP